MATNEDLILRIGAKDDTGSVFNAISRRAQSVGVMGNQTATSLTQATNKFDSEFRNKLSGISERLQGVDAAILGITGGIGTATMATQMWESATQRQSTQFYLGANLGTAKAKEMSKVIQDIVSKVPGDDTFMNTILSGSLAKQTDLSTAELQKQASVVADYLAGSEMQGKNAIEAQQDMKSYILSGSTAELERSSILSNQIDKLKGKATIQERINALEKAETAEKIKGLSGYDTAQNKMMELQGQFEKAFADVGETFLPTIQKLVEGFISLNDATGGGLATALVGIGGGLMVTATALGTVGSLLPVVVGGFDAVKSIPDTLSKMASITDLLTSAKKALFAQEVMTDNVLASEIGLRTGLLTSIEAETLANTENTTVQKAGLFTRAMATAETIAQSVANEGLATTLYAVMAGEYGVLAPILLIVAAIALLVVAFEQVGEYFGWWSDFSTMLESIQSGITRLWDAFINSPQVKGTIQDISNALETIGSVIGPVVDVVMDFFNIPQGAGSWSDPVGDIISAFGSLGKTCGDVVNFIKNIPNALNQLPNAAQKSIFGTIVFFATLPIQVALYLTQVVLKIISWGANLLSGAKQAGTKMINGFINTIKNLPARALTVLLGVVTSILSMGSKAMSTASQVATNIVTGFKNGLHGIADYVYQEFAAIPGKITSSIGSAVDAVKNFGASMWDTFKSAIGANSPSMFYKQIAWDFEDIPSAITSQQRAGVNAVSKYGSALIKGFNYQPLSSNLNLGSAQVRAINTIGNNNANNVPSNALTTLIVYVQEGAVQLDARNLTTKESKQIMVNAIEGLDMIDTVTTK